jgi:hypothetical protein
LYITAYRTVFENSETVNLNPYPIGHYTGTDITEKILPQAFGNLPEKPALNGFAWKQILKRNLVSDNEINFIPELQPYEDQIFNIDVIKRCESIYIDDNIIYNYIVSEDSITAKIVSNFDEEKEWKRISGFWREKRKRATEPEEILACSNQALIMVYSMLLNMAKEKEKSVKVLADNFKKIIDESIIKEIAQEACSNNGVRLNFVKSNLKKHRYKTIFFATRIILKILHKNG